MPAVPQLGVVFAPSRPITELVPTARELESLGFDELWVVEDCFFHGGLTAAGAALAATDRLRVGIGLLPATVRNPAIVAMELATLATLYPGRVQAAFGHGIEKWMEQIAARPPNRLRALEEVLGSVRQLLAGATVSREGRHVRLDGVALEMPPERPPDLLVGTIGERGIEIARRLADGLLLPEGSGEAALRVLAPAGTNTTVYSWLRLSSDGDEARRDLLPTIDEWRSRGYFPRLAALGGVPEAGPLEAHLTDELAIAGTPPDCARAVERLAAAGARAIALVPVGEAEMKQVREFAGEVLPLLRGRISAPRG